LPIQKATWGVLKNFDMHLVKGQSTPTLLKNISFLRADGTKVTAFSYIFDPPALGDVTVKFSAQIQGHMNGDTLIGAGAEIGTLSGIVKVTDNLPPIRLHNFILVAQITNQPGTPTQKIINLPIHIHIHDSVSKFWLTPNPMTIRPKGTTRPDKTEYRFSVRVQFDDGIVGDLTDNHGVAWSTGTSPGNIDKDGFITLLAGDDPGDTLTVSATLSAAMGSANTTGTVNIERPWDDPTTATIIAAGGWPGKADPNTVPNFLFLCDGFSNADDD
jgi:hypothetical protein